MTRRVLDFDPLSNTTTYFDYDQLTDHMHITTVQNVNPVIDAATKRRNDEDYSRRGMKGDMWHYARIPDSVALEMRTKYGVDMLSPKVDWKAVLKCINTHYPALKTTTKHHAV
jgi:hypothetical protein